MGLRIHRGLLESSSASQGACEIPFELNHAFGDGIINPLTQSVFKVVLLKSTPPQIRRLILHYYLYKEYVDRFVWELAFVKRLQKHFARDKPMTLWATFPKFIARLFFRRHAKSQQSIMSFSEYPGIPCPVTLERNASSRPPPKRPMRTGVPRS